MIDLLKTVKWPGLGALLGMTLLSSGTAEAQVVDPELLGYRVALLGAASDPSFNEDIRDNVMLGSRGVAGVYQIVQVTPLGVVFIPNPLDSRPGYEIAGVDIFDVTVDVPQVDDIQSYDALLVYNDVAFVSPDAVGDLAAAMVELGKPVILTGAATDETLGVRGRFDTQSMSPVTYGSIVSPGGNLGVVPISEDDTWTTDTSDNAITGPNIGSLVDYGTQQLGNVEFRLLGGNSSTHVQGLLLRDQAFQVHQWTNGEPANVFLPPVIDGQGATAVANWNPVSDAVDGTGWIRQTSGGRLLANVILEAVVLSRNPAPGDIYQRPSGFCFVVDPVAGPIPFQTEGFLGQVGADFFTTCDYAKPQIGGTPFGTLVRCADDNFCVDATGDATAFCPIVQNRSIEQDLNCNGLDVSLRKQDGDFFETRFDPFGDDVDDMCQNNIDPLTGQPFDNADVYFDYFTFECDYFTGDFDVDGDGLSSGTITLQLTPDPLTWETVQLSCDNCPDYFNPNQFDWDQDGVGDVCDNCPYVFQDPMAPGMREDSDGDGFGNACDNCFLVPNPDLNDSDNDGYGDACDNCPDQFNNICGLDQTRPDFLEQEDDDVDGAGDACDNCLIRDVDGDGQDETPYMYLNNPDSDFFMEPPTFDTPNPSQDDTDRDGWGDACDVCPNVIDRDQEDADLDGVGDACDNCPGLSTTVRADSDQDGRGDACDNCDDVKNLDQFDLDFDGIGDACDNCISVSNEEQFDSDEDGVGDFCDNCQFDANPAQGDADGDGFGDMCDNCPTVFDTDPQDRDGDGFGDACDFCIDEASDENLDTDGDGAGDVCDNCPTVPNFDQTDSDGDDIGDACDLVAFRGGGELAPEVASCSHTGSGLGFAGFLASLAVVGLRRRRSA
ncbi:MAG: thrombospondin type 3 repeat-containing protein [Myxococcota bacterium]